MRVDFYTVGERFRERPLMLVCKLCAKALDAGLDVQILCVDQAQARAIDEALWAFDPECFLPHAMDGEEDAAFAPIRLSIGRAALTPSTPFVLNLTVEPDPLPRTAARLAEVVLDDDASKLAGRARFRSYRAAGLDPKHHVL